MLIDKEHAAFLPALFSAAIQYAPDLGLLAVADIGRAHGRLRDAIGTRRRVGGGERRLLVRIALADDAWAICMSPHFTGAFG
jgi:hypothetical protein